MAEPFSDQQIKDIQRAINISIQQGNWDIDYFNTVDHYKVRGTVECIDRFLATITQYEKALDGAMRQVSSLNQGNIADRKRIEELEHECLIHKTDYQHSHVMRMQCKKELDVATTTIADQAATIERIYKKVKRIIGPPSDGPYDFDSDCKVCVAVEEIARQALDAGKE